MTTIDRDRLVRAGRVREVVFILILVGSVAQELEAVNSFERSDFWSIRPTCLSILSTWPARTSA